jgi:hypothetical protein
MILNKKCYLDVFLDNLFLDISKYCIWTNFVNDDKYNKYFISNEESWKIRTS